MKRIFSSIVLFAMLLLTVLALNKTELSAKASAASSTPLISVSKH